MSVSLTLVVLTYNEEVNLPHCLESVEGLADDVFVVDSGSTDGTREVARDHGAEVVEHPFEHQAQQFNWALDHLPIETDWILRLDADEYLLPELRREIRETLPSVPPEVTGFYMKRRVIFQGRWIRHGGYYPTWLLRLFRRGKGRSEMLEMDEHLVVTEGETRRLEHDFVDHNRKGLSFWLRKHEGFAEREARELLRRERDEASERGRPIPVSSSTRPRATIRSGNSSALSPWSSPLRSWSMFIPSRLRPYRVRGARTRRSCRDLDSLLWLAEERGERPARQIR